VRFRHARAEIPSSGVRPGPAFEGGPDAPLFASSRQRQAFTLVKLRKPFTVLNCFGQYSPAGCGSTVNSIRWAAEAGDAAEASPQVVLGDGDLASALMSKAAGFAPAVPVRNRSGWWQL